MQAYIVGEADRWSLLLSLGEGGMKLMSEGRMNIQQRLTLAACIWTPLSSRCTDFFWFVG